MRTYNFFHSIKQIAKSMQIYLKAKKRFYHYKCVIKKKKVNSTGVIRFGAYVVFDSTYGMDMVFKYMMNSKRWVPFVIIIPDLSRGDKHMKETYLSTKDFFLKKYGDSFVKDGYDFERDVPIDRTDELDIIYYANPYDSMVAKVHSIVYSTKKQVLPVYASYGYDVGAKTTLSRLRSEELNYVWKYFADNIYLLEACREQQIVKGENVVVTGYSKMDSLVIKEVEKERKKILICSHHTISSPDLPLSTFLDYSSLFLELPDLYPDIDFIFRPHPLLFTMLIKNKIWDEKKVEEYIFSLKDKGFEYSIGGDYFNLFQDCDAMINDCGSFTIEWLFTEKPGCFLKNSELQEAHCTKLMNEAISLYNIANSKEDILEFIDSVKNDKLSVRNRFDSDIVDKIKVGYPNVSKKILHEMDYLENI